MKKITNKSPLWVAMALAMVFAVSCANDKTFEGKWKKTEKYRGEIVMIEFKSDKTGTFTSQSATWSINPWKANFSKKTLEMTVSGNGITCTVKADYKFTKNFKKLELKNVQVSGGGEVLPNRRLLKKTFTGNYDKQ